MNQYDLVVLGTGGGQQVATRCRAAGWHVAVINDGPFGGTCPVRGCIPKKVLSGTTEIAAMCRRLQELHIVTTLPIMDWPSLIRHKRTFTDPVPPAAEKQLRDAGIDVYTGAPRFTGNLQLEVNGKQLQAKKVHIAVGARPAQLTLPGAEHLITSDDFLELEQLPDRMVFVGGGYISFELAHIAARFGVKTTILHGEKRPLPQFDPDIIDVLVAASRDAGIDVELNAKVNRIERHGDAAYSVATEDGRTFPAGLVVNGAGRPPAIGGLNLEAAGVTYDPRRGIHVDEYLHSTSNPAVTASGDAADAGPPLSPVAGRQGALAADNLLGEPRKVPDYHSTSSVVYTTPAVARVGYLETEAREKGLAFDTKTTDLTPFFDAKRLNLKHAKSKVLLERGTERILGAHLIGNHAEDLINIFSLAIEHGLTREQLQAPIFSFPSSSDDLRYML